MNCHGCPQNCRNKSQSQRGNFLQVVAKKRQSPLPEATALPQVALVGMPNVGKSVLFNALTGTYVTVSNYPGTTVEIDRGRAWIAERPVMVVDTPGMYSLLPITEEEKVARDLLLGESFALAIHVVDAKNLGRMLPLTFQLVETGLPLLLAVNMIDEARQLGLEIKAEYLARELGIPVVTMAAAQGWGINELKGRIAEYVMSDCLSRAD